MGTNPDIEQIIRHKLEKVSAWAKNDLPRIVGKEAVDHFRDNFNKEGFVDDGLHKWPDVKRRDESSSWYGFDYKGEKRTSYTFKRDKKTGKFFKDRKQKKLNYSKVATQRKILNGPSHELQNSLRYIANSGQVTITSDKPYAAIQNEGGTVRVFGKGSAQLPARPFVGDSKELSDKIDQIIDNKLNQIFK